MTESTTPLTANGGRELSGCRAGDCVKREACERYHRFLQSTAYRGFNAFQLCKTNDYLHFIEYQANATDH
jgi:hypothetical protein